MKSSMPAKSMILSIDASICLRDKPGCAVEVDVLAAGELAVEARASSSSAEMRPLTATEPDVGR